MQRTSKQTNTTKKLLLIPKLTIVNKKNNQKIYIDTNTPKTNKNNATKKNIYNGLDNKNIYLKANGQYKIYFFIVVSC